MSTTEFNGPVSSHPARVCGNGHALPDGASFCPQCGSPAPAATPAPAPVPPPPPESYPPPPPAYAQVVAPPYAQQNLPQQPGASYPAGAPYPYQPVATGRSTNGLAIASMVLGIIWVYWLGSVLALIFGFIALNQIGKRNEGGRGMAIAGIVLGFIGLGVLILVIILAVAVSHTADVNNGNVILPLSGVLR